MMHEGFCSPPQGVHYCDMGHRVLLCQAVPAWHLLRGCPAAGLALTSRQHFQAFSCIAAVPSAGNIAFCHDFLPGFDSLCLLDRGAVQGAPCRCPADAAAGPTAALSGP